MARTSRLPDALLICLAIASRLAAVWVLQSHFVPRSTYEHGEIAANLVAGRGFAIKFLGAAYLVWLGGHALLAAWRNDWSAPAVAAGPRLGAAASFRQGVISDLGNPKMAVFFASLLPQFVPGDEASFVALLSLGAVFCVLTFVWLAFYAALIARVGDVLRRPPIRRAIEGITGAVLIALGIRLAAEQR